MTDVANDLEYPPDFLEWWRQHCRLAHIDQHAFGAGLIKASTYRGWLAGPGPLDVDRFERLLDRLENIGEAQRIKAAPHPTRDRLLEAIRWVLGEQGEITGREVGQGVFWWRAELRRRCGL